MSTQDIKEILSRDYFQLLLANYQLWPLAMTLNFYLMPLRHQVLFTNSVSLAWNTYLSWKANKQLVKAEQTLAESMETKGEEEEKEKEVEKNPLTSLTDINNNYILLNNN